MSEKTLNVTDQGLETLPPLPRGLRELNCSRNNLTELPKLPEGLQKLICTDNYLTQLPELPEGLQELICIGNQLTELPVLPNSIKKISFDQNPLRPAYERLYTTYKKSTSRDRLVSLNIEIIKQKIKDLYTQLQGIAAYKVAVAVPKLSNPTSENASGAGAGPAQQQRVPYIVGETGDINSVVLSFISGKEGSVQQQKEKLLKDILQLKQKYFKLTKRKYNQNVARNLNEMEYQDYDLSYIPTSETIELMRLRDRQNNPENYSENENQNPQGGRRKARFSRKGRKTRKLNRK